MNATPVITVDHVSKRFRLYHERNQSLKASILRGGRARFEEFWALDDVSFEVPEGSTFGLIGENGSGKSTLLKCIARILRPDKGSISARGKLSALLELGAGFHPELSGRENVYLNGSILGLSKKQLDERFDEIVAFAGIEHFIDTPVKNYSSGMYVRLGFSVAINVDPDLLLIDEVLAVGDAEFQRKCTEKIAEFRGQGKTIVIVSHSLPSVRALCDEVALLEHGKLIDIGPPGQIIDCYLAETFSDAPSEDGLVRWGSGEVRIERVEMLDASGVPITHARTGDDVTLRFHYFAREPVVDAVFGLAVHTNTGIEVTGPNVRHAGLVAERVEGTGFVDFRVPRLLLVPGAYDLVAVVYDFSCTHPYDHIQNSLRFEVEAGNPYEENGIVSLGGEWSGASLRVIEARKWAG
jgi:ABC-type polysaccharide/polyol phosphate transport system ATPase subunit